MSLQGEYVDSRSAHSADKGGSLGMCGGARPREKSVVKTWADLSLQGECANSGGACSTEKGGSLGVRGGARPREKSVVKAWAEIMDEEQKK